MTNNLNEPNVPEPNPLMETPIQPDPVKTDGYNEAVKQGNSVKIVLLVVIFLIFGVLVAYILMNYFGGGEEPETVTPTAVPTVVSTIVESEPTVVPSSEVNGLVEFSYAVNIRVYEEIDYVVSGKAPRDAEQFPSLDNEYSGFSIRGDGYELFVNPYSSGAENMSYEDFVILTKVGDETIARVKDNFHSAQLDQYRYVKGVSISEVENCESIGPDVTLTAPCGTSHYTGGNQVETFYVLEIICDADVENVSKCDDIVKTLEVKY